MRSVDRFLLLGFALPHEWDGEVSIGSLFFLIDPSSQPDIVELADDLLHDKPGPYSSIDLVLGVRDLSGVPGFG